MSDNPGRDELPSGGLPDSTEREGVERGRQEGGIADRLGRDPSNLGDDVGGAADITHPTPEPGVHQI